jgi:polyhydroxyalkanoate synthesis regulator phasin
MSRTTRTRMPDMVLDALRGYLQLASGVTEESRQRAAAAARSLLSQGGDADTGGPGQLHQVAALAEELMVTSRANRELLLGLIRTEVERTLSRLGIATADEVEALRRSVERLERLVREQRSPAETGAGESLPAAAASEETAAKRPTTKKATSKAAPRSPATRAAGTGTSTVAGLETESPAGTVVSGTSTSRGRRTAGPTGEKAPARPPARRRSSSHPSSGDGE